MKIKENILALRKSVRKAVAEQPRGLISCCTLKRTQLQI
jgi:hypothetical protein